jgi:hypothetical protein
MPAAGCQVLLGEMLLRETSLGETSLGERLFGEMTLGETTLGETLFGKWTSHPFYYLYLPIMSILNSTFHYRVSIGI